MTPNATNYATGAAVDLCPATVEDLVPGAEVWYTPILGGQAFRGVVASRPWKLGHGAIVATVMGLEPGYADYVGLPDKTRVASAVLEALHVRKAQGGAP